MRQLFISFSGGRTSAYMTWRLLGPDRPADTEIVVAFANTGCEHEKTLEFIDRCDRLFGFGTVWIEAVTQPAKGDGVLPRIVTIDTASRNGEPFEAVIRKHGVPNRNFQHCTRELKARVLRAYMRSIGWAKYQTAIGIRADETDRMNVNAERERFIYPLIGWGVRKPDVLAWWSRQSFDLGLPEHLGNCTWCWKKSLKKHLILARENPEVYAFPARMEATYPDAGPGIRDRPRRFFRGNLGASDLLAMANGPEPAGSDESGNCSESCEVHEEEEGM